MDDQGSPDHTEPDEAPREAPTEPNRRLVEGARLIVLGLSTGAALILAEALELDGRNYAFSILLGVLIGYVLGGVFGRTTATAVNAMERQFQRASAADLLSGAVGLMFGLVFAFLLTFPLFRLPPLAAYPATAFAYLVLGMLGYRIGRHKRDDFLSMFGLRTQAAGASGADVAVVDTSALIDARVVEVARSGFLPGTLLVTHGVLSELQSMGDSSDPGRRARGRRGLDAVRDLQAERGADVVLVEERASGEDVDTRLVRLARERGATLVTNDAQLRRVAEALHVRVLSLERLAGALRPVVVPGQVLGLRLAREGREAGQGVGFLDDGTMVVVEGGSGLVGTDVQVRVTNVLQTPNGRMLFAELAGAQG